MLADQKAIVQRVEAKSASDLERAQRDIVHLQGRIGEMGTEKGALRAHIDAQTNAIAELKAVAGAAVTDKEAAEAARRSALDAYARQLCVAGRALACLLKGRRLTRRRPLPQDREPRAPQEVARGAVAAAGDGREPREAARREGGG